MIKYVLPLCIYHSLQAGHNVPRSYDGDDDDDDDDDDNDDDKNYKNYNGNNNGDKYKKWPETFESLKCRDLRVFSWVNFNILENVLV